MARTLDRQGIFDFIDEKPRTGHLATVREDGRPHVATIWIAVDREREEIVFNTGITSVKGKNLLRTGYAALAVDDDEPPFSFVTLEGPVTLSEDPVELRRWSTILGGRYMGEDQAEAYGERNGVPGEYLVRLRPSRMNGARDIAE
jgi:PPOX class probable F420-dependent enzyme